MKKIPLSKGTYRPSKNRGKFFALVDDEDYKRLNEWDWTAVSTQRRNGGYAMRNEYGRTLLMHRVIMDAPEGMTIDHINGNGLDNRRENLRIVTAKANHANKQKNSNRQGYKGVYQMSDGKWRMQIAARFDTAEEAAHAFDRCATAIHGEHAALNFP